VSGKLYGIDVNENNVTMYSYLDEKAVIVTTNFSKVVPAMLIEEL